MRKVGRLLNGQTQVCEDTAQIIVFTNPHR
jgi:hypothetical protein